MARFRRLVILPLFLSTVVSARSSPAAEPEKMAIVQEGKAAATVVTPDQPTVIETTAAQWLVTYVKKASGAELGIAPESKAPSGAVIAVGHTALAKKAGIATDDLKYDGCKLIVRESALYLVGRDTPAASGRYSVTEPSALGTCRAVTKFLEDFVGVRWLAPVTAGEVVPEAKTIAVPKNLNVAFSPAFAFTTGRPIYGVGTPASIANNFRCTVRLKSYGGHSYYDWVPAATYFKTHPEYFAMNQNGQRSDLGNHLCTSNPEVRELFRKNLFQLFDQGYDWVALGQTDGFQRCHCPACEAKDRYGEVADGKVKIPPGVTMREYLELIRDYPPERLFEAHKWLIDEAKKRYPDKKIHMLVYGPTMTPSKKIQSFGDNVILEICGNANLDLIKQWQGKAGGFSTYVVWFDPTIDDINIGMSPEQMSDRIRELHALGCLGIYFGGGGEGNWGFMGPTYYVLAKMMGDPSLDYRTLVKEYCDGLYGKASPEMQDFFVMALSRTQMGAQERSGGDDRLLMRFPPTLLASLEETLANAELKADTERSRNLIRMTRDEHDLNKLLVAAVLAYRNWQMDRSAENWKNIQKTVGAFDAFRERVTRYDDKFADTYFPGWGHLCNYITSEGSSTAYYSGWQGRRAKLLAKPMHGLSVGYQYQIMRPLTLNLDKPPEFGSIKVRRAAQPPALDGKLGDPAWKNAEAQLLPPMTSQQPDAATRVRMLYDDKYLYVAFECDEPMMNNLQAKSLGRDGAIWRLDCVETLFSPDRSRKRYFHYIVAPADNSVYDDRTGFRTVDDQDDKWNGPMEDRWATDPANKRWTLEMKIPFTTFETTPPKPGAWWLGNFGRERQAQRQGAEGAPDLFLWSQSELMGFCDPSSFGRILFVE